MFPNGTRATCTADRIGMSGCDSLTVDPGAWRSAAAEDVVAFKQRRLLRLGTTCVARTAWRLDSEVPGPSTSAEICLYHKLGYSPTFRVKGVIVVSKDTV